MKTIDADAELLQKIDADSAIAGVTFEGLVRDYDEISQRFHAHFSIDAPAQHANALFHKVRYCDLLSRAWNGRVLDVGDDKPFLSYFLRKFNPESAFFTISNELPQTPFPLWQVDIEQEAFPFESDYFDEVIFTEVLEHLWRDPSFCLAEINRVTKHSGKILLTTPNPCDIHAIICVLWQANPNQRGQFFSSLESGHLHLWTVADVRLLLESHGYAVSEAATQNLYGHTKHDTKIEAFIGEISPHRALMNETVVVTARKQAHAPAPAYPAQIYPDGGPVLFSGAVVRFAQKKTAERG